MPVWTQDHSDALQSLVDDGLSATEVAVAINSQFGTTYSRNAALSRAKKLGLTWARPSGFQTSDETRRKALVLPSKPSRVKPNVHTIQKRANIRARDPGLSRRIAIVPTGPVEPRRIPLLDLGKRDCRFIVEGSGVASLFCAVEVTDWFAGQPGGCYCPAHRQLCSGRGTEVERSAHRQVAA